MHTNVLTVTGLCSLIPPVISTVEITLKSIEEIFLLSLKLNVNVFNDFGQDS